MATDWESYWAQANANRKANQPQGEQGQSLLGGGLAQKGLNMAYKNLPVNKGPGGEWQTTSDIASNILNKAGQGVQGLFTGGEQAANVAGTPFGVDIGLGGAMPDISPAASALQPGLGSSLSNALPGMARGELVSALSGQPGQLTGLVNPLGTVMSSAPTTGPMGISSGLTLGELGPGAALSGALPAANAATMNPLASGLTGGLGELALSGGQATPEALASAAGSGVMSQLGSTLGGAGNTLMSGLTQLGTMLGGLFMSDEEQKKDKKKKDEEMEPFLDALQAYGFKYKNQEHGKGQKFGIMAQDLEKSKVGKALVHNTPIGKQVDIGQGVGTSLAALSYLHKRLKKLEGAANGKRR